MPVKSAAECTVAELNARGLHYMDLAESACGDPRAVAVWTRIAQGYFQAVTAATAIALHEPDGLRRLPDGGQDL